MTPNDNALPHLSELLRALEARCQGVLWKNGSGQLEPAFERVEIGDVVDLKDIMGRLVINQSRFCVLVYSGAEFTTERRGTDLHVTQRHSVVCLLGDRVLGNRVEAYLGTSSTPGAYELQRLVAAAVTGNLIENPKGAYCMPTQSFPIVIQNGADSMPGRAAIELDLEIAGGEIRSSIGRTPIR